MVLIISVIISVACSVYLIKQNSRRKEPLVLYEKRFSLDPVELDPIEDAALMGAHHLVRMEFFDLIQKGYVQTTIRNLKGRRGRTVTMNVFKLSQQATTFIDSSLSPVQQKILLRFKELDTLNEGVGGGSILSGVEDWTEIDPVLDKKEAKYEELGLAYPVGLAEEKGGVVKFIGCLGLIVLIGVAIIIASGGYLDNDKGLVVQGIAAIFILCIPFLIGTNEVCLPKHPPKAEVSLALMREKWAGKTITENPSTSELQHQNLMIMGALGTVALAGTAYASFADAFPAASVTGSSVGGGSCSGCGCGGCGGGDGGSAGGGCGGGCGGCGGG